MRGNRGVELRSDDGNEDDDDDADVEEDMKDEDGGASFVLAFLCTRRGVL